jgi:calcineurin-like phosphoesterase family protein
MGDVFFTADTHFGHRNIIAYANRPFACVEEMDEVLIQRWNERVRPGDRVYHLGDFSVCRGPKTGEILTRLNGEIHLVWGNHDRPAYAIRERFASYHDYLQITVCEQFIVCFHYAMRVWNKSHKGSWHLYGHSHGSLAEDPHARSMDVGVDCNDFYPFSFDEVADHMKGKEYRPVDHHTPGGPW